MLILHHQNSNHLSQISILTNINHRTTISFYKYFPISNPKKFRDSLYHSFTNLQIFGRIYIAKEGINAQISVPKHHIDATRHVLYAAYPELDQLRWNMALDDNGKSFRMLRIKTRPHIISDGIKDPFFNFKKTGCYLKAEEVNAMMDDPDTVFVDIRNHYEYEVGHFEHSIPILADTFRETLSIVVEQLQSYRNKKIIMYCTGGIRCEKATAWLLYNGFKNVFQIEGGILEYVRRAKEKGLPIKFIGKNFVFDDRLGERISLDIIAYCHQCGTECDNHTNCRNQSCHLLFIQCSHCSEKYDGCCHTICQKELSIPLSEHRNQRDKQHHKIKFNKSRKKLQFT